MIAPVLRLGLGATRACLGILVVVVGVASGCRAIASAPAPHACPQTFQGTVGAQRIWMRLCVAGEKISGTYFYESRGAELTLIGAVDRKGHATIAEHPAGGMFAGEMRGGHVHLTAWRSVDRRRALPVAVVEVPFAGPQRAPVVRSEVTREHPPAPPYDLEIAIPVLSGLADPYTQAKFNSVMRWSGRSEAAAFRKELADWLLMPPHRQLPNSVSEFGQNYEVVLATANVVSLWIGQETYFAGAAHPSHHLSSVTYDLAAGRFVTLDDMFVPGSAYLDRLSKYCIAAVVKDLAQRGDVPDEDWVRRGAAPLAENFSVFALAPDALLVRFQDYQVASYASGMSEVRVPYAELRSIIRPGGVIASVWRTK